jgi:ParB/RepB/Spo0J family partition protein
MKISISKIKPHPINKEIYTLSNLDDLIKSIKDVGLLQPLIINQFNQIISGHRRFECIKKLGWDEVDVEIKNVDEVETDYLFSSV